MSLAAPTTWIIEDVRGEDAIAGNFEALLRIQPSESATALGGVAEISLWVAAVDQGTVLTEKQLGAIIGSQAGHWPKLQDASVEGCLGAVAKPARLGAVPWVSLALVEPGVARLLLFAFQDTTAGVVFLGTAWMPAHPPEASILEVGAILDSFEFEGASPEAPAHQGE